MKMNAEMPSRELSRTVVRIREDGGGLIVVRHDLTKLVFISSLARPWVIYLCNKIEALMTLFTRVKIKPTRTQIAPAFIHVYPRP